MFGKKKDAAFWRKQLEELTTDFLGAEIGAQAVALFDDPDAADPVVDLYRYFEEDENPAELVWPIFSHLMHERGRIAMADWKAGAQDWIRIYNEALQSQDAPLIDADEAQQMITRATRPHPVDTIVNLQSELSGALQARGFALMDDGGGQDAFINYLAPPEAARRWDGKEIGRDMRLTIITPKRA